MRKSLLKKGLVFGILILFISTTFATSINVKINKLSGDRDTEYWALLVAVGVYADHPEQDRPYMLSEVENLYDMLLVSEHWKEDHIKVIKGENCTVRNIVKGLRWLDSMDDKDDFSLVFINTHGFPLSYDIPPFDEDDRRDEALVSYWGFKYPWAIIWDDLLNLFLSLLDSKGVCVVIDSCYSGGFNDPPFFRSRMKDYRMNANEWMEEFAEDLSGRGRVVLMSCQEDELSYGSRFIQCLIKSLRGYADANEDGLVSAEEAYQYVKENMPGSQHPTIYDGYQGELQLTEAEFPPSRPEIPTGLVLGDTNTTYEYSTVSIDPEGGKISYGWDWDSDYIVDEWTEPVDSNTRVITSHSWANEGTYKIRVKAKDERGLRSGWSKHIVVMMSSDNIPDQQQTIIETGVMSRDYWSAQSFIPLLNSLSKIELEICSFGTGDPQPLCLYIRDSLSGDNLAESSRFIPYVANYETAWFIFDFDDLDIIPGNTYYIVLKAPGNWWYKWRWKEGNPYPFGKVFYSEDGNEWHSDNADFCFVTWSKVEYPIVFNPIPEVGDSWVPIDISQLSFSLKDSQGDLMNYTVETVPDIGTGNGFNVGNGRYSVDVSGLENSINYYWFVNVTDGEHWNNKVFNFKTQPKMVFDPFDEGWQYRKKIKINHNKVAGNLTDFPVLIRVVDDDLKNKAQGDGDDILFMNNHGIATRLFHEIESFDDSSGELVAWVNVTNLSSSVDTVLYMYYGNSGCDSQEYPDHVWDSSYCGVWHLDNFDDSTFNDNDGTNHGTVDAVGKIGKAKEFTCTASDYIDLGDMPEPSDDSTSKATFEAWVNPKEEASSGIINKMDNDFEPDRRGYNFHLAANGKIQFGVWSGTWYPDGRSISAQTDDSHVSYGTWQHIIAAVDLSSNNIVLYYNGEEKNSTINILGSPPTYFYDILLNEWLGAYRSESGTWHYDGFMDEVRISKTCRSADWVLTQYNNQNEPSSFFNVGPEES